MQPSAFFSETCPFDISELKQQPPPYVDWWDLPEHMDNCTKYAGMAVDYHNSNHKDADFELVEPLNYMYLLHGPYPYAHLNYVARNRNPNCNDTSPVLFFAELNTRNNEFTVCSVVVPGSPLCKIGCGVCRPDGMMYHPLYGCVAGNYCYGIKPRFCPYKK